MNIITFRKIYIESNDIVRKILCKNVFLKVVKKAMNDYIKKDFTYNSIDEIKHLILMTLKDEELDEVIELRDSIKRLQV